MNRERNAKRIRKALRHYYGQSLAGFASLGYSVLCDALSDADALRPTWGAAFVYGYMIAGVIIMGVTALHLQGM